MKNNSDHPVPPKWAIRFLGWFCPAMLYETIEGDLIEQFEADVDEVGERRARRRFVWNVMKFFRTGIIVRNKLSPQLNSVDMFQNNIKVAWRRLLKDKTFGAINVLGLSLSIAACLLILQYAHFEMGYDSFYKNAKQIYRVTTNTYDQNELVYRSALSSQRVAPALKSDFPEVIESVQLIPTSGWFDCTLRYEHVIFNELSLYYGDASFFKVFSFPLKEGDPATALQNPYSIVLNESSAKRYFGNDTVIGKILRLKGSFDDHDCVVTGVMRDLPKDSHLDVSILLSLSSLDHLPQKEKFDSYTYVLLTPGSDLTGLETKLPSLVAKYLGNSAANTSIALQPVKDIHFCNDLRDEPKPGGNESVIYFLLTIAAFILFIAWINYINLSTSRALERAKEVGIRKISGAPRSQLITQFLTESTMIHFISIIFAWMILITISPAFYKMVGLPAFSPLSEFHLNKPEWIVLAIFSAGIFMSGYYPARIISSFNPILVLKGKFSGSRKGLVLRKGLVVFQFICAIGLLTGVFAVQNQFEFMQQQKLGIDITNTLVIEASANVDSSYMTRLLGFKKQLQTLSLVTSVTTSTDVPGQKIGWVGDIRKEVDKSVTGRNFAIHVIDADFITGYKLNLTAGRDFQPADLPKGSFGSKLESVILNEQAARQLSFKTATDAVGTILYWGENKCIVVGVVADYHQESFKRVVQPTLFTVNRGPSLSLKLGQSVNAENFAHTILIIHKSWDTFFADNPFDYFLLEDFYAKQYSEDLQLIHLFNVFCGLAILVSCLGLFGLSSFATKQRTKEIGIRKVLGAPVLNLIALLTKEFLFPVTLACCVALPLSYFAIQRWLTGYAFRMEVGVWLFITPVFLVLVIALLTIGVQTVRTAATNPVESLRTE